MPARPLSFTNTLGHRREEFQPLEAGKVRVYTCGPTVYSYVHIGNFRSFLTGDILRRVLEYNGYEVTQVRNITDVGHLTDETLSTGLDRMEASARQGNTTPWDIAKHFTETFQRHAELINLRTPTFQPRATEFIEPMVALTQRLIDAGYGYPAGHNVYFDVSRFPRYGSLSGNTVEDLVAGARVEVGEDKRGPADFALWRGADPDKIMRWESPWGEGVPGWHLECSAMAFALLGEQIDIHTGGVDNIFPHHEDEIAQSEAATGTQFARFWLHTAHLRLPDDEKMSKSLGNIWTLADLETEGISPLSYRYFTFQAHYRTPLNFSWDALRAAQTALYRLWEAAAELVQEGEPGEIAEAGQTFQETFRDALNDDLNLPAAVAVLHDVMASTLKPEEKLALLVDFDRVLALDLVQTARKLSDVTEEQRRLLDERAAARTAKDWSRSDSLRDELRATGLEVRDTPKGQRWARSDVLPGAHRDEA